MRVQLGEITSSAVASSGRRVVLVPLGSLEQHGPHLPLDTDARIAVAIASAAAAQVPDAVVAPVLAYGASGEHQDFPGTLSIGTDALRLLLVELVRSAAHSFLAVVLVNGHGGNHDAVGSAVDQLVAEGHQVTAWWPRVRDGDAHAGRTETALVLAICPELVRSDLAEAGNTTPVAELLPDMRAGGVVRVSANGVLGDPTGATAAEGRDLLAALRSDLVAHIEASGRRR